MGRAPALQNKSRERWEGEGPCGRAREPAPADSRCPAGRPSGGGEKRRGGVGAARGPGGQRRTKAEFPELDPGPGGRGGGGRGRGLTRGVREVLGGGG